MRKALLRTLTAAAVIGAAAMSLTACSGGAAGSTKGSFKVGFADPIAANSYMQAMSQAAQKAVQSGGGTFIARDAGLDPNKQISDLQYFINVGVKAIIVPLPPVYSAIEPTLEQAKAAGIAVIGVDIKMDYSPSAKPPSPLDAQVVEDRQTAAEQQVQYLQQKLPKGGQVLYIGGPAPTPAIAGVESEFKKDLTSAPSLKIVQSVNNMTDDIAGAKPLVAAALQAHPGIKAIVAYNDSSAVGAAQAEADAGKKGIVILGLQAMPEGIASIKSGGETATWDLDVVGTGDLVGQLAVKAAKGESGWKKTYIAKATRYDSSNIDTFVPWSDQVKALKG